MGADTDTWKEVETLSNLKGGDRKRGVAVRVSAFYEDPTDPDHAQYEGREGGDQYPRLPLETFLIRFSLPLTLLLFAVIVENTFVCIDEMVVVLAARLGLKQSSWLRFPLAFFITSHWNSGECIGRIKSPLLLISGLQDELIPPEHMNELFAAATSSTKKRILRYEGGHNDTFLQAGDVYYEDIERFLDEC